jgi:hypothetical protein
MNERLIPGTRAPARVNAAPLARTALVSAALAHGGARCERTSRSAGARRSVVRLTRFGAPDTLAPERAR